MLHDILWPCNLFLKVEKEKLYMAIKVQEPSGTAPKQVRNSPVSLCCSPSSTPSFFFFFFLNKKNQHLLSSLPFLFLPFLVILSYFLSVLCCFARSSTAKRCTMVCLEVPDGVSHSKHSKHRPYRIIHKIPFWVNIFVEIENWYFDFDIWDLLKWCAAFLKDA